MTSMTLNEQPPQRSTPGDQVAIHPHPVVSSNSDILASGNPSISLQMSPDQASLEAGYSTTQSLRTSGFAMSDNSSENRQSNSSANSPENPDSVQIRKAYKKPSNRINSCTTENSVSKTENVDYFNEKDFRKADRF